MAKLNKQEIDAVASKIYDDISAPIVEYNNSLKTEQNKDEWVNKFKETPRYRKILLMFEKINTLNAEIRKENINYKLKYDTSLRTMSISCNCDIEDIIDYEYNNSLKFKNIPVGELEIARELIIAQAMNSDLETVIKQITDKYTVC